MADETEPIEEIEEEATESEQETVSDLDSIRSMIRQELESILGQIPGEGVVQPQKNLDAPVTLREIERISREKVEAEMAKLRDELKPKEKPKPKPKPKPEPEPKAAPPVKEVKNKLRSILWGDDA